MTTETESALGVFERYLSLWVTLCIVAGVIVGAIAPRLFQAIAALEYANVNLVVALFIWVMIYPMMVNVDFASLRDVGKSPKDCALPWWLTGWSSHLRWPRWECFFSSTFLQASSNHRLQKNISPV